MASLRDIKKRISSVQSTKQITRTMEMVASAKIRHATNRVVEATPYSVAMEDMLGRLASESSSQNPLLESHEKIENVIILAIVSDRGLAGAFNSSVMKSVDQMVQRYETEGAKVTMIACGKKAITYFAYRGYEVIREYRDLSADPTIDQAREIGMLCSEMYTAGTVDAVHMIYNHARNAADQDLVEEQLLPISAKKPEASESDSKTEGKAEADGDKVIKGSFEFEPDAETVLSALLPGYLETVIYHGLIDSAAAEQGARRKAMKSATDNASDMIDTLTRVYNRARQSAITTEITEIIGGAAAAEE